MCGNENAQQHASQTMSDQKLPLHGLRILDIATFIAAPFCGTLLAEFGAEVIKVEKPGVGDPLRKFGTETECGDTLVWLSEARNKKSVTLDLRQAEGAKIFKALVEKSDAVLENFRPGTLERWGLGFEDLKKINPGLIMLRISGYGQTGPYKNRPGFARVAHAFGGLANLAGEAGGPPVVPGSTSMADYMSGMFGALGVMIALRSRDETGEGQFVDIGLYESVFRVLDEMAPVFALNGLVRERMGADTVNVVPHSHYKTRDDRWVAIACSNDKMFHRLADAMEKPELKAPDVYGLTPRRLAERDKVNAIVSEWTGSLAAEDLLAKCEKFEVPCSLIFDIADIFTDPQFAARENLVRFTSERAGEIVLPGIVPKLSGTPGRINSVGPTLGEHNSDIYGQLAGLDEERLKELREKGIV
jgi:crotonobetainyl-CoA:carnitine CoA-transferase CaiB-like acyl-CoA transferase